MLAAQPVDDQLDRDPALRRRDQRGAHLRAGLVVDIDVIEDAQRSLGARDQLEQRVSRSGPSVIEHVSVLPSTVKLGCGGGIAIAV